MKLNIFSTLELCKELQNQGYALFKSSPQFVSSYSTSSNRYNLYKKIKPTAAQKETHVAYNLNTILSDATIEDVFAFISKKKLKGFSKIAKDYNQSKIDYSHFLEIHDKNVDDYLSSTDKPVIPVEVDLDTYVSQFRYMLRCHISKEFSNFYFIDDYKTELEDCAAFFYEKLLPILTGKTPVYDSVELVNNMFSYLLKVHELEQYYQD